MFPAKGRCFTLCPVHLALTVNDLLIAAAAPFVALLARDLFEGGSALSASFGLYAFASAAVSLVLLWSTGSFRVAWRFFGWTDAARALQAIALGVAIGALCGFALDRLSGVARAIPFIQVLVQFVAFVGARKLSQRVAKPANRSPNKARQVLVVGSTAAAVVYVRAVRDLSGGSIEVAGFLTNDRSMIGQTICGKRVLGAVSEAKDVISTLQVHGVDVWKLAIATSLAPADEQAIEAASSRFSLSRLDVDTILSGFTTAMGATVPVVSTETSWKPLYAFTKRSIDLAGSVILLMAAAPVMLILCPIVAMDVGFPLLFWQQRLGKDGRRLTVYKFRTMRAPLDSAGRRIPDSRRVSAVGDLIRKLRLDELPQLISILKGDMSFVGPRPLLPIDQPLDAARRLAVKPGLTGWAQVHGGNLVAIDDKNAMDLWYVAHSSLRLDIEIVVRTIFMLMRGDNLDSRKIEQAKVWLSGFDYAGT